MKCMKIVEKNLFNPLLTNGYSSNPLNFRLLIDAKMDAKRLIIFLALVVRLRYRPVSKLPWYCNHRAIILIEGACLAKEREESDASFPDQNVQRHSVTSHGTARSLASDSSGGGLRGNSPGIAASPISLLSMGGVCGRSLTAGKILFTGRQTCSLYLVLWLCGCNRWETRVNMY